MVKETPNAAPGKIAETTKLYMENTLLRVAGALFCHDAKRAPTRTGEIRLNRGVPEKGIVIRPDPKLGQPGPLAHKLFVALIKKHSGYGRPVPSEISFSKREIMRLIGRKEWGGRDSEQLARALHEIHHAFVTAFFKNDKGRFVEHSFNIFPEILIERREFASDPIEACTVTLARPIVASLRDDHFTCLNHDLMSRLGTVGQALYMRLFFHFANPYDGRNAKRLTFPKRYDDVCAEWLGGLTVLAHRSKIIAEQLGPHLDQLVAERFLSSYAVEKARSRDGFVVTFRPGAVFFEDYDRFYRFRAQGGLQFEFHGDRRDIGEPLQVAYLFAEKRTGQPVASIAFVPSKDVETAKQFLAELPFAEMANFMSYALAEAKQTNFDVQTLGGLKQYLAPYLAHKKAERVAKAWQATVSIRQRQEADRAAYEAHRSFQAKRILAGLPADERVAIQEMAESKAAAFSGSLRQRMTNYHMARIAADRYPDQIPSFEEWQAGRAA